MDKPAFAHSVPFFIPACSKEIPGSVRLWVKPAAGFEKAGQRFYPQDSERFSQEKNQQNFPRVLNKIRCFSREFSTSLAGSCESVYDSVRDLWRFWDPLYPQGFTTTATFLSYFKICNDGHLRDLDKSQIVTATANSPKLFLRALQGETLSPPPIWLMRQAGRYLPEYRQIRASVKGFLDLCYNPDLATEVTLQPLRRYGFDAAILFSDILVIPDALGQAVSFREGEGPHLTPIRDADGLKALSLDRLLDHLEPVLQTVGKLSTAIPSSTTLIGFAGAPWTIATYMVEGHGSKDYLQTKLMMYRHPDLFQSLIDLITEATIHYLDAQIRRGAEVLQLFDSWAGVLAELDFERWVIAPTRKIVDRLKQIHPTIPIIGFPRCAGALLPGFVERTGVDAVSLDSSVPLQWAVEHIQSKVTIQGNLDPVLLAAGGSALDDAVDRLLEICGKGRFIFNLGHGILQQTPPDHVAQLVERVRRI